MMKVTAILKWRQIPQRQVKVPNYISMQYKWGTTLDLTCFY